MESKLGPNLKVLELRDCRLSVWAIGRLARYINKNYILYIHGIIIIDLWLYNCSNTVCTYIGLWEILK